MQRVMGRGHLALRVLVCPQACGEECDRAPGQLGVRPQHAGQY